MKIEIGDTLTRVLGGSIEIPVVVASIDIENNVFSVGTKESKEETIKGIEKGREFVERILGNKIPISDNFPLPTWDFNLSTGLEIDEDLGWDGVKTTGSYILEFYPQLKAKK